MRIFYPRHLKKYMGFTYRRLDSWDGKVFPERPEMGKWRKFDTKDAFGLWICKILADNVQPNIPLNEMSQVWEQARMLYGCKSDPMKPGGATWIIFDVPRRKLFACARANIGELLSIHQIRHAYCTDASPYLQRMEAIIKIVDEEQRYE